MLPAEVLRFIVMNIDTVPHMEALILLHDGPGTAWTAEQLASRIYVPVDRARLVLDDLESRHLLATDGQAERAYRYAPSPTPPDDLVERVIDAYRTQLVFVTRLIHAKSVDPVREFARAFKLKPPEE